MKKIIFKKLFHLYKEKDRGSVIDSICLFENYPWIYQTRVLVDNEAKEKGYRVENVVTQYRRRFRLDLWILIINLEWKSKDKSTPNPSLISQK